MSDARKDGYHHNRYTVAKLARFVGVTPRTIERWWKAGKLPEPTSRDAQGTKQWTPAQAREILEIRKIKPKRRITNHGL